MGPHFHHQKMKILGNRSFTKNFQIGICFTIFHLLLKQCLHCLILTQNSAESTIKLSQLKTLQNTILKMNAL